jgi:2-methylisocitrate lyase-like PEP mutase family enzyme
MTSFRFVSFTIHTLILLNFLQSAQMVCSLDPTMPVIADADTGFGGPAMIARTVTQYARSGVAAMHIEDQVQTKRCGHLLGKQVVSREEFVTRIRAAVLARDSIPGGSDFVRLRLYLESK